MPMEELEILKAACCVAGVDGGVSDQEMMLLRALVDDAAVGQASFKAMLDRATAEPDTYRDEFDLPRGDPTEVMKTLVDIARAQGGPTPQQRDLLHFFADRIGFAHEQLDDLMTRAPSAGE